MADITIDFVTPPEITVDFVTPPAITIEFTAQQWPAGASFPAWWTTNQWLVKNSNTDNDVKWATIDKTFVWLWNVDNTTDLNKPISTATQTALDWKVDKTTTVNTKALSWNITLNQDEILDWTTYKQYSQTEKTKLAWIEAGAEVNNISDINATDLTDWWDSTLHYHSSDRNRANHTWTQTASTISDLNTYTWTLTNKIIDSVTNYVWADHIHFKLKNLTGSTIANWILVKAVWYESWDEYIRVAPISSLSDVAIAITHWAITHWNIWLWVNTWVCTWIDTRTLALNTIYYSNGSWWITATKPTSWYYQAVAIALDLKNDWSLLVEFTEPKPVNWDDRYYTETETNTLLNDKVTKNTAITWATKTKITYDSKGLVTSWADATTSDIADSLNKRYVTDANLTVINNTSNTNNWDNATNTQYSWLASSKQDTLVSWTNIKTINWSSVLWSWNLTISWTGDVVWPASATDNQIVVFNWATWKIIKSWPAPTIDPTTWNIMGSTMEWWAILDWQSANLNEIFWFVLSAWADIKDENSNSLLSIPSPAITSPINNLKISNSATWTAPFLESIWTDTNIDLNLKSKWTWVVKANWTALELQSNKVTSISWSSTDTQYWSAKLLYDQLLLKASLTGANFTGATTINPWTNTVTSLQLWATWTWQTLKANLVPDLITSPLNYDASWTPSVNKWALYNGVGVWVGWIWFSTGSFDYFAWSWWSHTFRNWTTNIDWTGSTKVFKVNQATTDFYSPLIQAVFNYSWTPQFSITNSSTASGNIYAGYSCHNSSSDWLLFKLWTWYWTYKSLTSWDLWFYNTGWNISILNEAWNINLTPNWGSTWVFKTEGTSCYANWNLYFNWNVATDIYPTPHTTANTAWNNVTMYGGWCSAWATNKNWWSLLLAWWVSTWTGEAWVKLYWNWTGSSWTANAPFYVWFEVLSNKLAFYGWTPAVKQTITWSRVANPALASLLTALATLWLITDSSTV